jgi:SAM-dependent methyltransferase
VIAAHVLLALVFVALFLAIDCYLTPLNDETMVTDLALIGTLVKFGNHIGEICSSHDVKTYFAMTTDRDYVFLERVMGPGMHTRIGDDNERQYDFVEIGHATHVLEIGCGRGHSQVLARRYPNVHFTCVDILARHIDVAKEAATDLNNIEYHQADATANLSWLGLRKFQVIFGVESLCYMGNRDKMTHFIEQSRALLAPGGRLVIVDIFRRGNFAHANSDHQIATLIAEYGFFCTNMPSKEDWTEVVGAAPRANINLTAEAMPFWTLLWRVARFSLYLIVCLKPFGLRIPWHHMYTLFNVVSLSTMAHALRGASEYGVLEFEFP